MANLKFRLKSPIVEIRDIILTTLRNSKLFRKQADIDRIGSQLDTVEIFQSFIPRDQLEPKSYVAVEELNKRMEGSFIDHLITYKRLENLASGLQEIEQLHENTVVPVINRILDYESKIRVFKKISSQKGLYNTLVHETFNYDNNFEGTERKLAVNKVTGSLRLNGSGKLLSTKERSNISYEILTEGVSIVDQAPIDNIYSRDPLKPWFVSMASKNFTRNKNYSVLNLEDYQGVVMLLRVQFPSVQQLNRITFSYFSTDVMDVLGVFYSEVYNQDLNSISLKTANISFYQNREDTAKELNIVADINGDTDIINAAEVLIVFGQKDYVRVNGSFSYDRQLDLDEFQMKLKEYELKRKTELYGMNPLKNQNVLFDRDRVLNQIEKSTIDDGDRNYILGLTLFAIENISYEPFGTFRSKDITVNGNIVAFSLDVTKKTTFTIREAVEMAFININTRRLPIATLDEFGRVADSTLLTIFDLTNNQYLASTNFIPEIVDGDFKEGAELYLDGQLLASSDYSFYAKTPTGWSLLITAPAAHESSILTMTYYPAAKDHNNTAYEPTRIDMVKVAGKPNVDINFLTYNLNDYVFIKSDDDRIVSFKEGVEITYIGIDGDLGGIVYALLPKTGAKGIVPADAYTPTLSEASLFNTNDYYYIPENKVVDVDNEVYTILKNQRLYHNSTEVKKWSDITSPPPSGLLTFTLPNSYIKNMIVIEVDKILFVPSDEHQYGIDSTGDIKNKTVINLPLEWFKNGKDIRVHYMPLFYDYVLLSSNILNHNDKEVFNGTTDSSVQLTRFPYTDIKILQGPKWKLSRGMFFHTDNFSVTYEPIVVKVNNRKAFNVTKYRDDQEEEVFDERDITYTVQGNTIVFANDPGQAQITVLYYTIGNSFSLELQMFKGDASKYFTTPEINDYTVLMATRR